MKQKRLGNSDIYITEIGLGTNYIGGHNLYGSVDEQMGVQIVRHAVDLGINFIDTVEKLKLLAEKRGVPLSHLAIRWLLWHPAVGSVITGAKHLYQIEENVHAVGWDLTPGEINQIKALTKPAE